MQNKQSQYFLDKNSRCVYHFSVLFLRFIITECSCRLPAWCMCYSNVPLTLSTAPMPPNRSPFGPFTKEANSQQWWAPDAIGSYAFNIFLKDPGKTFSRSAFSSQLHDVYQHVRASLLSSFGEHTWNLSMLQLQFFSR